MTATWTFCSRDSFEFVELEPKKPSLYQRYFDWRDYTADIDNGIPASCRWQLDYSPRKKEFIEMREMPRRTTSDDGLEDVNLDVEGFDNCKPREEEVRKETRKEGLVRNAKSMVEFVSTTLALGRR